MISKFQQPVTAVHLVLCQGHVQQLVPANRTLGDSGRLAPSRKHRTCSKQGRRLGAVFLHCTRPVHSTLGTRSKDVHVL